MSTRAVDRDARAASLMVEAVGQHATSEQRWLVAGDPLPDVGVALGDVGAPVGGWDRLAGRTLHPSCTPSDGPFDAVALRLPRGRPALHLALHLVAARMAPGAKLWLYGANDEGVRSAPGQLEPLFEGAETVDTRKHCRLWVATRTDAPAQGRLEQHLQRSTLELPGGPVDLVSYPGVFARGELDPGTALLLDALPQLHLKPKAALDFACGVGVIGAALRQRWPELALHALDHDALAVDAARQNLPGAEIVVSDGWSAADDLPRPRRGYDLVVSNPPLHRGNDLDLSILEDLVRRAPEHLAPGGSLVIVTQKQRSAAPLLEAALSRVRVVAEDTRFRVWAARRAG